MKQHHGFTLIEVLAAILLLALLVATLVPSWSRIRHAQTQISSEQFALDLLDSLTEDELNILRTDHHMHKADWLIRAEALSGGDPNDMHAQWLSLSIYDRQDPDTVLAQRLRLLFQQLEMEAEP